MTRSILFVGLLGFLFGINHLAGHGSNRLVGSATGKAACDCQGKATIDASMKEHGILCEGANATIVSTVKGERTKRVLCTVDGQVHRTPVSIAEASVDAPFSIVGPTQAEVQPGEGFAIELRFSPAEAGQFMSSVTLKVEYNNQAHEIIFDVEGWALQGQEWDEMPVNPACAEASASVFEDFLAEESLTVLDYQLTETTLRASKAYKAGLLQDEFVSPYLLELRNHPKRVACIENALASGMDAYLDLPHPSAGLILHAASHLQYQIDDSFRPFGPAEDPYEFDMAIESMCNELLECQQATGTLPDDLKKALSPIMWSIREGIEARHARDASQRVGGRGADWWQTHGANHLLFTAKAEAYDPAYAPDRAYLNSGREDLAATAAMIAFAVEDVDWSKFKDRTDVRFDLETDAGWIRVRDSRADEYPADFGPSLLLLDLGGADTYLNEIASNVSGANAISIAIDLGGDDSYTYPEARANPQRGELLAADGTPRYAGDTRHGPISTSYRFRQGAARNGIAMLFDFGEGDDSYASLRGSQGYAHQGVGILFDDGGDDWYRSESYSQGASQYGIALLIDRGAGNDQRISFHGSQGFGFTGGFGALIDEAGDDVYECNVGDPEHGGQILFKSPQLPERGNTSFCQGAGFGFRRTEAKTSLSGGLGILRDVQGNDSYSASVYAQGTGYWQGLGILSDGEGDDQYDALYYAQGSAIHYGGAILADGGEGNDSFGARYRSENYSLGGGLDFGTGIFINERGDDKYYIKGDSAGKSACTARGLFIDNDGDDMYDGGEVNRVRVWKHCSDYESGLASIGIAVDSNEERSGSNGVTETRETGVHIAPSVRRPRTTPR